MIYFKTQECDVFPYWTKQPEIGLRRIMALIEWAPKTGLTGKKKPVVVDRSGKRIPGLMEFFSDSKVFSDELKLHDFSKDWKFKVRVGRRTITINSKQVYTSECWCGVMPNTEETDAAIQNIRDEKNRELMKQYGDFWTEYQMLIELKFDDLHFNNFFGVFLDLLTSDNTDCIQMHVCDEFRDLELMRSVEQEVLKAVAPC